MLPDTDAAAKPLTSLVEKLLGCFDDGGDHSAIVFENRRRGAQVWPRSRLRAEVAGLAAALRAIADPGDRALVVLPTGPDYVVAFLACLASGIIAVPATSVPGAKRQAERQRLEAIARDCTPKVLIGLEDAEQLAEACDAVVLAPTDRKSGPIDHPIRGDDVAFLQYTSGSTASPKGVMVTFDNLSANLGTLARAFGADRSSTIVSWLPLYHDMGLISGLLLPLHAGCRLVLTSPLEFAERPRRWLELITRYRGTITLAPNFAYQLCTERIETDQLEGLDLSSLTVMVSGAEPIRPALMARFYDRFAAAGLSSVALQNCYGLAEATLMVSGTPIDVAARSVRFDPIALAQGEAVPDVAGTAIADCGPPAQDCMVAIVDPADGLRKPPGHVGEIWVAGPGIAPGYWRRERKLNGSNAI